MSIAFRDIVTLIASLFSSILAFVVYKNMDTELKRREKDRMREEELRRQEAERLRYYQELLIEFSKDGDTKVVKKISPTTQRKIS